jgi:endonuclease/exonuclease/phosphatase family metal-dependent hydrolase
MDSRVVALRAPLRRVPLAAAFAALVGVLSLGLLTGDADAAKKKGVKARVMTRNLYLGADLRPGLDVANINQLVDFAGEVANQVDRTNFPHRAQALAAEILEKRPHLVGLQEVALWRTAPTNTGVFFTGPSATDVEYDFLELLLAELNKSGRMYEAVVIRPEFDFETPVNDDGQGSGLSGADHNERLTMRDVILRRVGAGVKASKPTTGTFIVRLQFEVSGIPIAVTRGWTALDAKVRDSKTFRFVNTHLEAYDDQGQNQASNGQTYGRGGIRAAQASQLLIKNGPATGKRVILLGDINSDDDTVQPNGDQDAYRVLLAGGFRERSTGNPRSCCLGDPNLVEGSIANFDEHIDHVMANTRKIKLVNSSVTGLAPVGGLWPADHAGVFSTLRIPAKR